MPTSDVLATETCIANAHRCLHHAIQHASSMRDLGLHDDLQLIQLELERLQVDLLRGTRRSKVGNRPPYVSQTDES